MQKSGLSKDQLENMKSPMDRIDLEKVIFPFIKFNTPVLQKALQDMKINTMCLQVEKVILILLYLVEWK